MSVHPDPASIQPPEVLAANARERLRLSAAVLDSPSIIIRAYPLRSVGLAAALGMFGAMRPEALRAALRIAAGMLLPQMTSGRSCRTGRFAGRA